jgi:hypothetical protein
MSEPSKENYSEARFDAATNASGSLRNLAASIDYLNREANGNHFSLYGFLTTYMERLESKARSVSRDIPSSVGADQIAYITHNLDLHERLVLIFHNVASSIEGRNDIDTDLLSVIKRVSTEIDQTREQANHFMLKYAANISADQLTDEYSAARTTVNEVIGELAQVIRTGQWTPEYITVTADVTRRRRSVELPTSLKMGRIAAMAPQLRKLGWNPELKP